MKWHVGWVEHAGDAAREHVEDEGIELEDVWSDCDEAKARFKDGGSWWMVYRRAWCDSIDDGMYGEVPKVFEGGVR